MHPPRNRARNRPAWGIKRTACKPTDRTAPLLDRRAFIRSLALEACHEFSTAYAERHDDGANMIARIEEQAIAKVLVQAS